jgi:hypothetical protein
VIRVNAVWLDMRANRMKVLAIDGIGLIAPPRHSRCRVFSSRWTSNPMPDSRVNKAA